MIQTLGFDAFYDGFSTRRENFTYDGLRLLFDHFRQWDAERGEQTEFDPIKICCEFNEYSVKDFNRENCTEFETLEEIQESIEWDTTVIGLTDDTIVYVAY